MRHTTRSVDFFFGVSPFEAVPSPEAEQIEGWQESWKHRISEISVIAAALTVLKKPDEKAVSLFGSIVDIIEARERAARRRTPGFMPPSVRIARTELGTVNDALKNLASGRTRAGILLAQLEEFGPDLLQNSELVVLTSLGARSLSTTVEPYVIEPQPALL